MDFMNVQQDLKSESRFANANDLADGKYSGKISFAGFVEVTVKATQEKKQTYQIKVMLEKVETQITYWLKTDADFRRLLTSLGRIGFDVETWGPKFDKPYENELIKAGETLTNHILSFNKSTTSNGYPSIGLDELSESNADLQAELDQLPF
jgi:hypothetical protein